MPNQPLNGRKVAVLIESQYIPSELHVYREKFKALGATVHFVSRLWKQGPQEFVSELEKDDAKQLTAKLLAGEQWNEEKDLPQFFTADVDVEKVAAGRL